MHRVYQIILKTLNEDGRAQQKNEKWELEHGILKKSKNIVESWLKRKSYRRERSAKCTLKR